MTNTAKVSKKAARLQGIIDTEISTIDQAIDEAVSNNLFECTIDNSIMTSTEDEFSPSTPAEAHCRMDIWSFELDDVNGEDYRVGDILTFADIQSEIPTLVKVSEIDEIGNPLAFEIVQEGIYDTIATTSALKYYDESRYLDITSDFGENHSLRINRNETYQIKIDDEWKNCNRVYTVTSTPDDSFGDNNSIFITDGKTYIKVDDNWQESTSYSKMPIINSFGNEYDMIIGLLGHNYIKLTLDETPKWYDFGDIIDVTTYPDPKDYNTGDVVYYTTQRVNSSYTYKLVKKNNIWYQIRNNQEYDYTGRTIDDLDDFGVNGDIITCNDDAYIKTNGHWVKATSTYNSSYIFRYGDLGEEYDLYIQDETYYCKIDGVWTILTSIFDLNTYDIGHNESAFNITWNINSISVDDEGDGYDNTTLVKVGGKESIAKANVEDGKVVSVDVIKTDGIYKVLPTVSFHMVGDRIAEKCYQIWKQKLVNPELQDAMKQVIDHYQDLKYSVSRVTNKSTGKNFKWKIRWY